MLWQGGALFETPPPLFEDGMFKPFPDTGARTLDSRTAFYYAYTLDLPAMVMRIPEVGSQYLMGFLDTRATSFDGAKTYKVTLPKDIPAANSGRLRSMTIRPGLCFRRRRNTCALAARPTRCWPRRPLLMGVSHCGSGLSSRMVSAAATLWVQTVPGKGWFTIFRFYSPLQPFFTKEWKPGEIELVKWNPKTERPAERHGGDAVLEGKVDCTVRHLKPSMCG